MRGIDSRLLFGFCLGFAAALLFRPSLPFFHSSKNNSTRRLNTTFTTSTAAVVTGKQKHPSQETATHDTSPVEMQTASKECSQLNWIQKLRDNSSLYPVPQEQPIFRRCDLAVIAAGMPRTGSTLTHRLLLSAAKFLRLDVIGIYWNHHLHVKMDKQKANKFLSQQRQIAARHYDVIVIKSHEFDDRALKNCRQQLVFSSHRNLVDETRSRMHAGWVRSVPPFDVLVPHGHSYSKEHDCWLHHGALSFRYEFFQRHQDLLALIVLSQLAAALDKTIETSDLSPTLRSYATAFLHKDAISGLHSLQHGVKWTGPNRTVVEQYILGDKAARVWQQRFRYV